MPNQPLERILYVEDNLDIQAVTILALQDVGGFTVETCGSGADAIAAAPRFDPHLFLLDVMLPGMDGPALLQALRVIPACADVPAIFMTAKVQRHEIAQLRAHGAIDIIAKPFDPMRLAADIRTSWQHHVGGA